MISHGSITVGNITDHRSEGSSGDVIFIAPHSSSNHSYSAPPIPGKGDWDTPKHTTGPAPDVTVDFSHDIIGLKRCTTNKTTSSDNVSLRSYRAASIIDLYCDGLTMMEEKLHKIDGTDDMKRTRSSTLSKLDAPRSRDGLNNLDVVQKGRDPFSTGREFPQSEPDRNLFRPMKFRRMTLLDPYANSLLHTFEEQQEEKCNKKLRMWGEDPPPYVYVVMGPRWEQWATWTRPANVVDLLESSYEGLLVRAGGTEVLQRDLTLARRKYRWKARISWFY